jgi:hypothetical protein
VADNDLRAFIRDITRRNELVWQGVMEELRHLHQASREHTAEIRDLRDETRAQREGLLKLIDEVRRLGEDPGIAPA